MNLISTCFIWLSLKMNNLVCVQILEHCLCIVSVMCSVRRLEGEQGLPKVGKRREKPLSRVRLFATPWTVADQVPLSMGFSRQEYWSGLPFPSPGHLPDPGSNLGLPHCRQPLYHLSRWEVLYKWLMLLLFSFHCFLNSIGTSGLTCELFRNISVKLQICRV